MRREAQSILNKSKGNLLSGITVRIPGSILKTGRYQTSIA